MTLTDIHELLRQALSCPDTKSLTDLLDEFGEDCDDETVRILFSHLKQTGGKELAYHEEGCELSGQKIACPDCHNANADKLLSSFFEVLSGEKPAHFGCCECGTQFTIG